MLRRLPWISIALGLALLATLPSSASASWVLSASEDGGASSTIASGGSTTLFGTSTGVLAFSDFSLNATIVDFQDAAQALLSLQTISVNNASSTTHTLTLTLEDSGFTLPGSSGTGLTVNSHIAADRLIGTGSLTFETFADGASLGLQTVSTIPGSAPDTLGVFTRLGTYDIKNVTTITLSAGGQLQETGSSYVTPVPEPATLTLALCGLGFLACPLLRKRANS